MKTTSIAALLIVFVQIIGFSQEPKTNQDSTSNAIQEKYRDIEKADGFRFLSIGQVGGIVGGLASGTLEKFGIVDSSGKFTQLELVETNFTNGHIKTKLFGDILISNSERVFGDDSQLVRAGVVSYAATESQIKKIHEFLAKQSTNSAASPDDMKRVTSEIAALIAPFTTEDVRNRLTNEPALWNQNQQNGVIVEPGTKTVQTLTMTKARPEGGKISVEVVVRDGNIETMQFKHLPENGGFMAIWNAQPVVILTKRTSNNAGNAIGFEHVELREGDAMKQYDLPSGN